MAPKAAGKDQLQQKSPAEFFAENKNIAGFDNVRSAPNGRGSGGEGGGGRHLAAAFLHRGTALCCSKRQ